MKKDRNFKWLIFFILGLGVYGFFLLLDLETFRSFLLFWEETFRKNWSDLTKGLSDLEIYKTYLVPGYKFKRFPFDLACILLLRSFYQKYKGIDQRPRVYYNSFFKYLNSNTVQPADAVFIFSAVFFIGELVKFFIRRCFPYTYGPLFLILPLIYMAYYLSKEYKAWQKLGSERSKL